MTLIRRPLRLHRLVLAPAHVTPDRPQVLFRPLGQGGDAVLKAAAEAVELPQHDRLHPAMKDVGLQAVELWPLQRRAALLVAVPLHLHRVDAVVVEPLLHFGPLPVVVLAPSADPDVRRHGHVCVVIRRQAPNRVDRVDPFCHKKLSLLAIQFRVTRFCCRVQ